MTDRVLPVVIVGAHGRMGQSLIRCVVESDDLTLVGAVDRSGSPGIGRDAGAVAGTTTLGIPLSDNLAPPRASVVVDFSLPEATGRNIDRCVDAGVPLILGTTGIDEATHAKLGAAASRIPVVFAPNFSVGVNLFVRLANIAAKALGEGWDAELFELHHRHKRDAPSGTALRIGRAVADAREQEFGKVATYDRTPRDTARDGEEIGVVSLRGGDSVGEHTLMFLGEGERLELAHRAGDRRIFANGALRAARWAVGKEPGLYDMLDVLGL